MIDALNFLSERSAAVEARCGCRDSGTTVSVASWFEFRAADAFAGGFEKVSAPAKSRRRGRQRQRPGRSRSPDKEGMAAWSGVF